MSDAGVITGDHLANQQTRDLSYQSLADHIAAIAKAAGQIPDRQRRETIPALFRRSYEENFLSEYLAYILDPKRNGVGSEPLQALLSLAYDEVDEIDPEQVDIDREYTFEVTSIGRIDFLIKLGEHGEDGIIGIENKLYSPEGDNQTAAYARGLAQDFPGRTLYLIFLSPEGRLPLSKEFRAVSYRKLLPALRDIRFPVLNDIHKCVIWEDFLAHLEEYIVMEQGKLELSGQTLLYLEHRETLEKLKRAFESDAEKAYNFVTPGIKYTFGDGWHFNFQGRNSFQEINRISWAWNIGKFYIFYQYRFSRDNILTVDQFPMMLGVYPGKHAGGFIQWLKTNYPQIPGICQDHGMNAYSREKDESNSLLIAYKIYPLEREDLSRLNEPFILAAQEFSSTFTPLLDEAVQAYKKQAGI